MSDRFFRIAGMILVLLFVSSASRAQWVLQSGVIDQQIHRGLPLMYNMDFGGAEKVFDSIIAEDPNHPAGYFYRASVMFWRTVTNPDNTKFDDEYKSWIGKAIDKADALLDKN